MLRAEDIHRMYNQTLILYKDMPMFVMSCRDPYAIILLNPVTQKRITVPFELELFGPPKGHIGYVNYADCCKYFTRAPRRMYYNGLNVDNLKIKSNPKCDRNVLYGLEQPRVAKAVLGIYPSIEECADAIEKGVFSQAFDKQFAIGVGLKVLYRCKVVGGYDRETKTIKFKNKFEFLKNFIRSEDVKNR